jgi:hypothetical protein
LYIYCTNISCRFLWFLRSCDEGMDSIITSL